MTPLDYAARIAYSSIETLNFTYEMAKKYADSKGVYVECGVAAGAQIIAMLYGANKLVFAFDSFEGIPLPSNRDDQMPGIIMLTKAEQKALPDPGKQALLTSGATVVSIDDFLDNIRMAFSENLSDYNSRIKYNLYTVQGWFEETVTDLPDRMLFEDIAILRLDGDLYNSTWVCLQHLFEKVIKGGVVIIDDWQLPGCQAACKEYFALIGYEPDYKFISNIAYFFK